MPTYEYHCEKCPDDFEVFQSMKDEPLTVCPKCGGAVSRVITGGGGVIFKGAGFYSTDNTSSKTDAAKSLNPAPAPACASCPHSEGSSPCPAAKAAG
ncbi:MAG: zinc ribbon domain-containing protein [Termitinemataceae bacterium]|nr:MAG: zinc ribbon domain-containing protein [Termitinemataceae bacterium]